MLRGSNFNNVRNGLKAIYLARRADNVWQCVSESYRRHIIIDPVPWVWQDDFCNLLACYG